MLSLQDRQTELPSRSDVCRRINEMGQILLTGDTLGESHTEEVRRELNRMNNQYQRVRVIGHEVVGQHRYQVSIRTIFTMSPKPQAKLLLHKYLVQLLTMYPTE